MPPARRDRAQVVCVTCHARKVKCNLQGNLGGKCQNCHRNNLECVVRTGPRSGRLAEALQSSTVRHGGNANHDPDSIVLSPLGSEVDAPEPPSAESVNRQTTSSSYVGSYALLAHDAVTQGPSTANALPRFIPPTNSLLQFAEATVLPKEPLLAALTESYFQHVFHRYPVVDRDAIASPHASTLLRQAVCMVGSLMRHSSKPDGLASSHSLYEKTKLMLCLNYEKDPVAILATLCLMVCWSPDPTDSLSLDCPWQWTGTAIRLATQMGLHREATYANRPDGGRLRRLWWVLVNADRLQAACFGRPLAVRYSDCDTKKPSTADFSQSDTSSLIFIHYIGLAAVWGEIADYGNRGKSSSTADITRLTDTLCTWIGTLPEEIRLFGPNGVRLPYRQSVSELHMVYLVTIILLEAMRIRSREHWSTATASIIAASCTARLIEEVDCWEDLSSMSSSTTFYIMAASIPLIHLQTNQPEKREIRQQDLQILCTTLERMAPRWGGAAVVRQNIEKIRNMVEWHTSDTHSRNAEQGVDQDANGSPWRYKLEELFPFPRTLSPTLDLLSNNTTPPLVFDIMDLPLADDALPWPDNESQSYLDFFRFNMYGDTFDIGEGSFGPLNTIGG